jgi:hypothetical protein
MFDSVRVLRTDLPGPEVVNILNINPVDTILTTLKKKNNIVSSK